MSKNAWIVVGVVSGLLLLSCVVCSVGGFFFALPRIRAAADRAKRVNELKALGLAVIHYQDIHKRGPANLEELAPELTLYPEAKERVRKGEIDVVWNARMMNEQDGASQVVLAWDTRADESGNRLVVYADGATAILTEQEFQKKSKAKSK